MLADLEGTEWRRWIEYSGTTRSTKKMGVAATPGWFHRLQNPSLIFLLLALSAAPPLALAQEDQVVFNVEATYTIHEEQPAGSAVVSLEAYYVLASPLQILADGIFSLDPSEPDSQLFSVDFAPSQDGSRTVGTLRNSVVMDRDAEGAQTVFSLSVTYSTPDGSLSTRNTVSAD